MEREDTKRRSWPSGGDAPYSEPGQPASPAPAADESTGVEGVGVNSQAPVNPAGAAGVVSRGLVSPSASHSAEWGRVENLADIEALTRRRMRTAAEEAEEAAREARRARTAGIIGGIADAARAVSNLYFTTRYAPNMYNAEQGLAGKARERYERARARKQAADDAYYNYALSLDKRKQAQAALAEGKRQAEAAQRYKEKKDAADADLKLYEIASKGQQEAAREAGRNARHAEDIATRKSEGAKDRAVTVRGQNTRGFDVHDTHGNVLDQQAPNLQEAQRREVYIRSMNEYRRRHDEWERSDRSEQEPMPDDPENFRGIEGVWSSVIEKQTIESEFGVPNLKTTYAIQRPSVFIPGLKQKTDEELIAEYLENKKKKERKNDPMNGVDDKRRPYPIN